MSVLYLLALTLTLTSAGATNPPNYGQSVGHEHDHNFSLKELAEKLIALGSDLGTIFQDIATVRTLTDIGHEKLVLFRDRYVTALKLQDTQQDALIKLLSDEVFDLRHREDVLEASVDKIAEKANGTASEIALQFIDVEKIQDTDNKQNDTIFYLEKELAKAISTFKSDLANSLAHLHYQLDDATSNLTSVVKFIDNRICEYGTVTLFDETAVKLKFKAKFDAVPTVAAAITGFLFDLSHHGKSENDKKDHEKKDHEKYGGQGHEKYGEQSHEYYGDKGYENYGEQGHENYGEQEHHKSAKLGSKIIVSEVTQTGFSLSVKSLSYEPVDFTKVSVSWVACANLDIDVPVIKSVKGEYKANLNNKNN